MTPIGMLEVIEPLSCAMAVRKMPNRKISVFEDSVRFDFGEEGAHVSVQFLEGYFKIFIDTNVRVTVLRILREEIEGASDWIAQTFVNDAFFYSNFRPVVWGCSCCRPVNMLATQGAKEKLGPDGVDAKEFNQ